ncbi:TonB-dependent receptor domain-containing protein [Roseomonas sp. F4]
MPSFPNWLMAGTAMGLVLAAPTLRAQEAARETVRLSPVVVTESGDTAAHSTIGQDRLNLEGAFSLDDLLRTVPGTFTRESAQQPGVAVNIRGFEGSGRVNMSIDGVRQNFRFTSHEAAGFTYVDPNLLADIDVTRGAVTGIGGGALAGTVNFRTLDVDDVVAQDRTHGGLTRLSWGSNGVGFQEMLAAGARSGGVGVVGAISRRNSDNYHDGDGNSVANSGQDLVSGLLRTNIDFGGGHSLSLGGVFYDNDFYANSYRQTVENRTLTANYRYNPGNPLIDLRVNAYRNDLSMKYTGGTGTALGRVIEDVGMGFDAANTSRFNLGPVRVRSTTGFEYFHDDVSSRNGGVNPGDGTSSMLGVFTENTFSYGIFDLTPALRYNHYALNGSGVLSSRYGAYDVDISEGSVDPKITLAANVTDWLQPFVTWSRSMRAPTLQETMLGGDHPGTVSSSYIPNPNLEPERQQGWEFGVNLRRRGLLRPNDMFSARLNYFMMDVEDYIATSYVSSARAYQFQNVAGTTKVDGFEAEIAYDPRVVFASLSYTHTNSRLPSQLPGLGASQYTPDDVFSLRAGARFLEEKLTVGARWDYVSGGLVAGGNASFTAGEASQGGDPYNLIGLFATYEVTPAIQVNARVTNLLDEAYTPFLSTIGTGQGRTVYMGTQIRF